MQCWETIKVNIKMRLHSLKNYADPLDGKLYLDVFHQALNEHAFPELKKENIQWFYCTLFMRLRK